MILQITDRPHIQIAPSPRLCTWMFPSVLAINRHQLASGHLTSVFLRPFGCKCCKCCRALFSMFYGLRCRFLWLLQTFAILFYVFLTNKHKWCKYIILNLIFNDLYKLMSTGTTLTKPSLRLHMMTVSSTSGIQRLMLLHRNLRNLTFTKLMNCCTHQNKQQSRTSRNIRYSAVNSSQKKRWICQLPLVRLNKCCCVYSLLLFIPCCIVLSSLFIDRPMHHTEYNYVSLLSHHIKI
jgi:hypothetical protein